MPNENGAKGAVREGGKWVVQYIYDVAQAISKEGRMCSGRVHRVYESFVIKKRTCGHEVMASGKFDNEESFHRGGTYVVVRALCHFTVRQTMRDATRLI